MTIFSTASRARLRHATRRAGGPDARRGREVIERGCVTETGTTTRTKRGRRRGHCPTPGRRLSRDPFARGRDGPRRPTPSRAAPLPQVGGPRRNAASIVAPARGGLARPPCLTSSYRSRSQSRARLRRVPSGRPLSSDLARQDLGTYRMDGADRAPTSPRLRKECQVPLDSKSPKSDHH